ncbi:MAG TPA: hypothetical protein EYP68_01050 [Candidatus Korarchaeota archaeon]|nr:hypothetical protein [Candidatus Korarchaeota archaeon]
MTHRNLNKKHENKGSFLTKEELEKIIDWAKTLSELAEENGCTIIVEGLRDMKSLTSLGVRGNFKFVREIIKSLKEGAQDDFCGQTYILLTDFDKEGKFLHLYLKTMLNSLGARVIEWPRARYLALGLPPRIEEAYNFVTRRRNK